MLEVRSLKTGKYKPPKDDPKCTLYVGEGGNYFYCQTDKKLFWIQSPKRFQEMVNVIQKDLFKNMMADKNLVYRGDE